MNATPKHAISARHHMIFKKRKRNCTYKPAKQFSKIDKATRPAIGSQPEPYYFCTCANMRACADILTTGIFFPRLYLYQNNEQEQKAQISDNIEKDILDLHSKRKKHLQ